MATLAHIEHDPGRAQMRENIYKYKEESAKVCWSFSVSSFTRLIAFRLFFLGNSGGVYLLSAL